MKDRTLTALGEADRLGDLHPTGLGGPAQGGARRLQRHDVQPKRRPIAVDRRHPPDDAGRIHPVDRLKIGELLQLGMRLAGEAAGIGDEAVAPFLANQLAHREPGGGVRLETRGHEVDELVRLRPQLVFTPDMQQMPGDQNRAERTEKDQRENEVRSRARNEILRPPHRPCALSPSARVHPRGLPRSIPRGAAAFRRDRWCPDIARRRSRRTPSQGTACP